MDARMTERHMALIDHAVAEAEATETRVDLSAAEARALLTAARAHMAATRAGDRVALWDAVNQYAAACGGDPESNIYGNTRRMEAVVAVEAAIDSLCPRAPGRRGDPVTEVALTEWAEAGPWRGLTWAWRSWGYNPAATVRTYRRRKWRWRVWNIDGALVAEGVVDTCEEGQKAADEVLSEMPRVHLVEDE